jgi:hypothetical protein
MCGQLFERGGDPSGQNTQPTSKLLENPEFRRARRMILERRWVSR